MDTSDLVIVISTIDSNNSAEQLAKSLVEESLAACVNLVPKVRSIYKWQGRIEQNEEILLVIKTRAPLVDILQSRLIELHPYDCPEFVALSETSASEEYYRWVVDNTTTRALDK